MRSGIGCPKALTAFGGRVRQGNFLGKERLGRETRKRMGPRGSGGRVATGRAFSRKSRVGSPAWAGIAPSADLPGVWGRDFKVVLREDQPGISASLARSNHPGEPGNRRGEREFTRRRRARVREAPTRGAQGAKSGTDKRSLGPGEKAPREDKGGSQED